VIRAALILLAIWAAPAAAANSEALTAATQALDRAIAAGLSREEFHRLNAELTRQARAAPEGALPALRELAAAAAATDAIWRDRFTGSLCGDPDEMAAALAELAERTRRALRALRALEGEP
jgi:hypothetical protein